MTTDDFLKQANKLYEAAIADLNDKDFMIDEHNSLHFSKHYASLLRPPPPAAGKLR